MTAIDRLRAAERAGRLLQKRATGTQAAALVLGWPAVAQNAHAVWKAMPAATRGDGRTFERIALAAASFGHAGGRQLWPADGQPDGRLAPIAKSLATAAESARAEPMTASDVVEGQRLMLSTLWAASAAIATAARDHSFDVRYDKALPDPRRQKVSELAFDASRRFGVAEQLAVGALLRPSERNVEPAAHDLRRAVARWDIEAHRALLGHRTTATLHVVSYHQADFALRIRQFVGAAAGDGVIDRFTHERLAPVFDQCHQAWRDVLDVASEFSFANVQLPTALYDAGTDLHNKLQLMPPQTAEGHRDVLSTVSEHLVSSLDVAQVSRDLVGEGELRAPARAIARVLAERSPDLEESMVSPLDIHRGATVPLPAEARDVLEAPTVRAVDVAAEAVSRSAGLDARYRRPAEPQPLAATISRPMREPQGLGSTPPGESGPAR